MHGLRLEEVWAQRCIAFALGVPVTQHDDGSQPGMHDLNIEYADRSPGAVEVTSDRPIDDGDVRTKSQRPATG